MSQSGAISALGVALKKIIIKEDVYYDSVFLMLASKAVKNVSGVSEAFAAMGTKANVALLNNIGFDARDFEDVRPNDLVIAVDADVDETVAQAVQAMEDFLKKKSEISAEDQAYRPVSLDNAIRFSPRSNLVVISVPGPYAAAEARLALSNDRHVMVFSDNVSIEEEIALKKMARDRGLLMMGPDCGSAIINGIPLCFANQVRRGDIGIVAASGSGLQEVTCCIDKMGSGISQALGTGGRDLKDPRVGGLMMTTGIAALRDDAATRVIVVISKPPAPGLAEKVISRLKMTGKACVICFLGQKKRPAEGNLRFAENLEEAARLAVALSSGEKSEKGEFAVSLQTIEQIVAAEVEKMVPRQKYLRGLYTGGTLADEALFYIEREGLSVHSNIQLKKELFLQDPHTSFAHTIVDLGDDAFTVGRPHPMIDPSIREERLDIEMTDSEVAVILMDFVLGYGAHKNPVGQIQELIVRARSRRPHQAGYISIIASITGTDADYQNMAEQKKLLESINCIVMPSNYQACRVAAGIIGAINEAR